MDFSTEAVDRIIWTNGTDENSSTEFGLTVKAENADVGDNKALTAIVTIPSELSGNFDAESYAFAITGNISKAEATLTAAPTAIADLVYSGSAQALVTAGTADGGRQPAYFKRRRYAG